MEHTGRTAICSVVFMDIVGYSKVADARQIEMKARLNGLISEAVASIAETERVVIDTGDGAALCFFGDPEDALFVATAVNDALKEVEGDGAHALRTGINLGPIKVVKDLNGRPNVVGDGINVAQRIMSFADDGEVLVSRSYYEVVARLQEGNEKLFRYVGSKKDKHVREHQVYAFGLHEGAPPDGGPATGDAIGAGFAAELTPDDVERAERRLTDRIGPLARVIVKQAADSAGSADAFYRALADHIPDEADRAAFLADTPGLVSAGGEGEASEAQAPKPAAPLNPEDLKAAERHLAEHIGPLAKVLVKKAAAEAASLPDLYARLAENIADAAERERFLAGEKAGS